jgi:hypothetical protein
MVASGPEDVIGPAARVAALQADRLKLLSGAGLADLGLSAAGDHGGRQFLEGAIDDGELAGLGWVDGVAATVAGELRCWLGDEAGGADPGG